MKALFISPPATSYIEPKVDHEVPLEVVLPRIPFEVLAHLNDSVEPIILDLEWEMDKHLGKSYKEIISNWVCKYEPDVVLTSIYAQSVADTADQITTAVKEERRNVPIVAGGQAIPHLGKLVFQQCPNIDFGCLDVRGLQEALPTLIKEKSPKVLLNGHSPMRSLPYFPPEHLYLGFPIEDFAYFYQNQGVKVHAYLENERGCPYRCTFCAVPRFVQERPIEATVAEAEYLLSRGISAFYLTDLTFGLNRKKAKELLLAFKMLRSRYPRFHFRCITRVDFIDSEMARLLKDAGCYEVGLGVETSSTEVLTTIRKDTTREQSLEAILIAAKAGLAVRLFLIIGLPGEDIRDLIRFLHEVNGITRNVLLQLSLSRPIVGGVFEERIASGELRRGTMHQLDFRTDGRRYGLDRAEDIMNFILLALAWPSTEISHEGNRRLQDRLLVEGGLRVYDGVKSPNGFSRRDDMILFDLGEKKLLYVPNGISVKIRQCLMECSDDFFEFLRLADGTRDLSQIMKEISGRFKEHLYYKTKAWAKRRAQEIFASLVESGLIQMNGGR